MKELIAVSYSGLADRIMMLLAGRKLAEDMAAKFTFIWPVNASCGAKFEDVLMAASISVWNEDYAPVVPFLHANDMRWKDVVGAVGAWTATNRLKLCAYPKEFYMPDFGLGKLIDFRPWIRSKADAFAGGHFDDDATIGVHIRARDMADQTPLISDYEFRVREFRAKTNSKVFLATDCPIVRKWFTSLVPNVVTYPSRTFDRSQGMAVEDAAIELALLRKCKRLVLSGYSGFSRMALRECRPPSDGILSMDYT